MSAPQKIRVSDAIEVLEEWRVVDRWWTDEPVERRWADVRWHGRKVLFQQQPHIDQTWRIYSAGFSGR